MTVKKYTPNWLDAQEPLQKWYSTSLGQTILGEMSSILEGLLPDIFGYQGLQIGQISQNYSLLESAGLHKKLVLGTAADSIAVDIGADALHLPIANDTMNLVILPHTLEFCGDPHQVLRESDRVLTDDGHLLIIGFNPYSSYGLRHVLMRWRGNVPWNGEFYSRGRIADWLSLLNFRILQEQTFFLRLPIASSGLLQKTRFVEKARPMLGKLGGVYIIHARKQSIPMMLVRSKWRRKTAGIAVGSLVNRIDQRSARQQTDK
ncbi:MAG: methyltransferase domain-containing protein [Gammaproteobacteria bacterium]|nr:methyltransferase domain-containing protein [Gammaproteobacteria bacterium]